VKQWPALLSVLQEEIPRKLHKNLCIPPSVFCMHLSTLGDDVVKESLHFSNKHCHLAEYLNLLDACLGAFELLNMASRNKLQDLICVQHSEYM